MGNDERYLLPSLLVDVGYLPIAVCLLIYSFLSAKFLILNECLSHMFRKERFYLYDGVGLQNCLMYFD